MTPDSVLLVYFVMVLLAVVSFRGSQGASPAPELVRPLAWMPEDTRASQTHLGIPVWPTWPPDLAGVILGWGYPLEVHWVTTEDGFQLQLFRLPSSRTTRPHARPVLLMHGLLDSCAAWVSNKPHQSLAFILHDAGFDVWLGNVRGSTWGLRHTTLSPSDPRFWLFSWDEMARLDLPAIVEHMVQSTGAAAIEYVGHSQGTTILLAALSSSGVVRQRVHQAVLLAPAAFVQDTASSILQALAALRTDRVIEKFGLHSFLPGHADTSLVFSEICTLSPAFCERFLLDLTGPCPGLNITRLPEYLKYMPAGTSVVNMAHWAQSVRQPQDLTLRAMDYGVDCKHGSIRGLCNQKRYHGARQAPAYALEDITTPLTLLSGSKDAMVPPEDVQLLLEKLQEGTVVKHRQFDGLGHLDFTLGTEAHRVVYPDVLAALADAHHD